MQTAEQVKRLIREGAKDFYVRQRAIDILLARGVRPKNYRGEIKALFQWVQRNIRYTKDPFRVEVLHSPRRMLELKAGDCDDMTILLGSMLESIGHPVRLVLTGPNPNKPKLFSHIYLEVSHQGRWIPLDATMPHPMGWSPRTLVRKVIAIQEEPTHVRGYGIERTGSSSAGAGMAPGTDPRHPARRREAEGSPREPAVGAAQGPSAAQPEPVAQGAATLHLDHGARRPAAADRHSAHEGAASAVGNSAAGASHRPGGPGPRPAAAGPCPAVPAAESGADSSSGPRPSGRAGTPLGLSGYLRRGESLYRRFNRFHPRCIVRERHRRVMPPVVVQLGDLVGLIYRSDKWFPGRPRTYIHFMQDPPRLVSDVGGRQLFVVGGSYRVTVRGIEG
jgi:hypothetical protein